MTLLPSKIPNDPEVTETAMRFYYENLFPFVEVGRWLSYRNVPHVKESYMNDPNFLSKREVCLTCTKSDSPDDEFFMRWQSFNSMDSLRSRLLSMDGMFVHKFDIGAVYQIPVSQKDVYPAAFKAQQKEVVFDIDMNDYDDIRTCCKDKKVCKKCWLFLAFAVRLLDSALRQDFGFNHILWVFSGRRGIHGWVCDTDARLLQNESRGQLAEYLNICAGSDQQAKKVHLRPRSQHPSVDRAFAIVYSYFHRLLKEQDFFHPKNPRNHLHKLLEYLPDSDLKVGESSSNQLPPNMRNHHPTVVKNKSKVYAHVKPSMLSFVNRELPSMEAGRDGLSVQIFDKLCEYCGCSSPTEFAMNGDYLETVANIPSFIKEIVLAYSYPRLDINVSKDIGHLLKSPFCIHRGTGRVCVPVNVAEIDEFDPERVPTLSRLRSEFDDPSCLSVPTKERTSLAPFVRFLRDSFVAELEQTCVEENKFLRESLERFSTSIEVNSGF